MANWQILYTFKDTYDKYIIPAGIDENNYLIIAVDCTNHIFHILKFDFTTNTWNTINKICNNHSQYNFCTIFESKTQNLYLYNKHLSEKWVYNLHTNESKIDFMLYTNYPLWLNYYAWHKQAEMININDTIY